MAVSVDKVIVELEAKVDRYNAQLKASTALTEANFRRQEVAIKRLEAQIARSSGQIGSTLKRLGGLFAGALTAQQIGRTLDSFTKLQNNLRVAGIEGENLKSVQDRLFASAQKYGVAVEGLSQLFGKLTQASKELGANQGQLFALTDAVSASLKIQGISAEQAQGALLQLGQVLQGGTVQAEEYNSLIDGLFPLLQAAANGSDRFGGSVAKLTKLVKSGQVSSAEFFNAILNGAQTLEGPASKATLTLSASFTTLTNALTVYLGEADKSNGVTAALAGAMNSLAENLDIVIPALAVIGGTLLVGYAVNATRAAVATGAASTAIFAMQAVAGGAATAMEGLAFASAAAGRTLLAVFGGPIGIAISAVAIGLLLVGTNSDKAADATGAFAAAQRASQVSTAKAAEVAERLATAHGKVRDQALAAARAEAENIKKKLESARASVVLAQAELARARAFAAAQNIASTGSTGLPGTATFIQGTGDVAKAKAEANVAAANAAVDANLKALQAIQNAISASSSIKSPPAAGKTNKGKTDHSAEKLIRDEAQIDRDIASAKIDELRARQEASRSASDRAELEHQILDLETAQRAQDIKSDAELRKKEFPKRAKQIEADAQLLLLLNEQVDQKRREVIDNDLKIALIDKEIQALEDQRDTVETQKELASTLSERRDVEQDILDIQDQIEKKALEELLLREKLTDAEADRLRANLALRQSARRKLSARDNETPLQAFRRQLSDESKDVNASIETAEVRAFQSLEDSLTNSVKQALHLHGVFGDLIGDLIQIAIRQLIIKQLVDSIGDGSSTGGGGNFFGNFFRSIGKILGGGQQGNPTGILSLTNKAKASGGHVSAGQLFRVNETGVEGFRPAQSGTIIPLGQMPKLANPAATSQPAIVRIMVDEGAMFVPRVQAISGDVSVQVVRAAAPEMVKAATAETSRQFSRPRL